MTLPRDRAFHIAACSDTPEGGIYTYVWSDAGAPAPIGFLPLPKANYLAFSADRARLYVSYAHAGGGAAASCAVRPDGALERLSTADLGCPSTCHVAADPSDHWLYVVDYHGGHFVEFALDGGKLSRRTRTIAHHGHGPNQPRQDAPHPHFAGFTPDGAYLLVVDLGNDAVHQYPFAPERGVDPEGARRVEVTPGAGPRHLVFDRAGRHAYLLNELGNGVIAYRYADGAFTEVGRRATLPARATHESKAAAIRLSPDERFLFATNRGYDTVSVFALDGAGGMEPRGLVFTGGSSPRDANFLPGGRVFAATNEFSGLVTFFDYDPATAALAPNGATLALPRPLCLVH